MNFEYKLSTPKEGLYNITAQVREAISNSKVIEGVAIVLCPHTTGSITITENDDPEVLNDFMYALDKSIPNHPQYRHEEGNSAAHIKASVVGFSEMIIITKGEPILGFYQDVYFCEFDPPRERKFYVKVLGA